MVIIALELSKDAVFADIAVGIRVFWAILTVVAIISIIGVLSHFVPRKEY